MQVQDFQSPAPQPIQESQFQDEWTPRYGILVGGVQEIPWNGIGEQSIGHHSITRRVWMPFIRLQVGRRNEFDGALDMPMSAIQVDWATNPDRVQAKSPRACANDVLATHKAQGYCVPNVLIGHSDPQGLTEKVWPREVRDSLRLWHPTGPCHVRYFESFQTDNEDEATLNAELLEAGYFCRDYITEYVRTLKTEMNAEKGLKNLNANLEELFHEIGEPLPEKKAALVAQEMGKEIVKGQVNDGRKDDAIINVLGKIADRLDRLEQKEPLAQSGDTQSKEASSAQTSKTSTRRQAVIDKE